MGSVLKCRNFCVTAFYDTDEEKTDHVENFSACGYKYICWGEETCPTTRKTHLQGYVMFKNARSFAQVKTLLPTMHIEQAKGNPIQNIKYCSKTRVVDDGLEVDDVPNLVFEERGERPKATGVAGGEANKRKWEVTLQLAKTGDIASVEPEMIIRFYATLKRIERDYLISPDNLDIPCGVWYYGGTGTGKSHAARVDYPGAYNKLPNKWWDGYQNEENVLIDDFDICHKVLGYHLKIWSDKYAFNAEVKGSTISIRPKVLVVTSNYHPREIWGDTPSTLEPLLRRFRVTNFANLAAPRPSEGELVRPGFVGVPGFRPPRPHPPLVPRPILQMDSSFLGPGDPPGVDGTGATPPVSPLQVEETLLHQHLAYQEDDDDGFGLSFLFE